MKSIPEIINVIINANKEQTQQEIDFKAKADVEYNLWMRERNELNKDENSLQRARAQRCSVCFRLERVILARRVKSEYDCPRNADEYFSFESLNNNQLKTGYLDEICH